MDFSKRQDDPRRHLLGLSVVVALHVLIVYALVNGLARKVVDVVRAPIETRLIEEIIKPPPPPPKPPPTAELHIVRCNRTIAPGQGLARLTRTTR